MCKIVSLLWQAEFGEMSVEAVDTQDARTLGTFNLKSDQLFETSNTRTRSSLKTWKGHMFSFSCLTQILRSQIIHSTGLATNG